MSVKVRHGLIICLKNCQSPLLTDNFCLKSSSTADFDGLDLAKLICVCQRSPDTPKLTDIFYSPGCVVPLPYRSASKILNPLPNLERLKGDRWSLVSFPILLLNLQTRMRYSAALRFPINLLPTGNSCTADPFQLIICFRGHI